MTISVINTAEAINAVISSHVNMTYGVTQGIDGLRQQSAIDQISGGLGFFNVGKLTKKYKNV